MVGIERGPLAVVVGEVGIEGNGRLSLPVPSTSAVETPGIAACEQAGEPVTYQAGG